MRRVTWRLLGSHSGGAGGGDVAQLGGVSGGCCWAVTWQRVGVDGRRWGL